MEMESKKLSKDEFIEWKEMFVTKLVFGHIKDLIEEGSYILSHRTEPDVDNDQLIRGKIIAWEDILNISFEE